jgi:hypothetical protein
MMLSWPKMVVASGNVNSHFFRIQQENENIFLLHKEISLWSRLSVAGLFATLPG